MTVIYSHFGKTDVKIKDLCGFYSFLIDREAFFTFQFIVAPPRFGVTMAEAWRTYS